MGPTFVFFAITWPQLDAQGTSQNVWSCSQKALADMHLSSLVPKLKSKRLHAGMPPCGAILADYEANAKRDELLRIWIAWLGRRAECQEELITWIGGLIDFGHDWTILVPFGRHLERFGHLLVTIWGHFGKNHLSETTCNLYQRNIWQWGRHSYFLQ